MICREGLLHFFEFDLQLAVKLDGISRWIAVSKGGHNEEREARRRFHHRLQAAIVNVLSGNVVLAAEKLCHLFGKMIYEKLVGVIR